MAIESETLFTLLTITGRVNSRFASPGGKHPDVQYYFYGYLASCSDATVVDPKTLDDNTARREIAVAVVALHPRNSGYVTIQSVDPTQPPLLEPNLFSDEQDLAVLADASRIIYKLANTTVYTFTYTYRFFVRSNYGMVPTEGYGQECGEGGRDPTDEFFKCLAQYHTAPENHQIGMCKMGPGSDPMAVVDMELKVHGIEGATGAPVIMIAERGAEFIMKRHQQSEKSPISQEQDDRVAASSEASKETLGNQTSNESDDRWLYHPGYNYLSTSYSQGPGGPKK